MTRPEGRRLLSQVTTHTPPAGGLTFWWLGQHSVILKMGATVVFVDPYLSPDEQRQVPALFAPEDVTNADWVLCSHDHGDHLDPYAIEGIVKASPQARFIVPRPAMGRMASLGVPANRLVGIDAGETTQGLGLAITGIKAAHEFFDHVQGVGHPYLGYVLRSGECCVYHSGDTLCYEGLLTTLQAWPLTVMFLPINGRDAKRYRANCIGNMTYQEAVDLAGHLRPRLVVPTHYDMFEGNQEDPGLFVDYLEAKFPGVAHWVGWPGQTIDVVH